MILRVHHDYVEDEYSNYYVVIGTTHGSQDDNEVILRNALVDICFSTVLIDEIRKHYKISFELRHPEEKKQL